MLTFATRLIAVHSSAISHVIHLKIPRLSDPVSDEAVAAADFRRNTSLQDR